MSSPSVSETAEPLAKVRKTRWGDKTIITQDDETEDGSTSNPYNNVPSNTTDLATAAEAARQALEKAKKAAYFQQRIQNQLRALVDKQKSPLGGHIMPTPLRLDKHGREIDDKGNVITMKPQLHTTLKINKQHNMAVAKSQADPQPKKRPQEPVDITRSAWFDQSLRFGKRKTKKALDFVEGGTFIRQEQKMRQYAEARAMGFDMKSFRKQKIAFMNAKENNSTDTNKPNFDEKRPTDIQSFQPFQSGLGFNISFANDWQDDVPLMEWWDMAFLDDAPEGTDPKFPFVVMKHKINNLVEHPVPILPPHSDKKKLLPNMYLTVRERKKLRRRKRQEKEKEKQDKIRMGIMPPPPPKVRLSNLMRVLGDSSVQDPSRVEKMVRRQMEKRLKDHEARNEARKLKPLEKRRKTEAKWRGDSSTEVKVMLFCVKDQISGKNLFKIDINAQQFHLKGVCVISPVCNMVVVEGSHRSTKRYKKLLLRRIQWADDDGLHEDDGDGSDDETDKLSAPNIHCKLLWEGVISKSHFSSWKVIHSLTEEEVVKSLKQSKASNYWDRARKFSFKSECLLDDQRDAVAGPFSV